MVKNLFRCSVDSIPDEQQDELNDLQNDFTAKDLLDDKTIEEFWIHMIGSYPDVAKVAFFSLLPFVSTYLCDSSFSTMLFIKTALRNHLELEGNIRCALSETSLCMDKLTTNNQCQTCH